ncbi:MAG: sugar phosphate isomerase/epimerase family protein [Pirellulales bacterium]
MRFPWQVEWRTAAERLMYRDLSLQTLGLAATQAEQIELALTYGFRGLDLDVVEFQERVATYGMPHSRRLLDSAKLRITACRLPLDPAADEPDFRQALEQFKPQAELAAAIGCTRVVTTLAPGCDSLPYHENFELHRKRFGEIAAVLAPLEMRLGVGFAAAANLRSDKSFEFIHKLDALVMLVGTVGAKNVGVVVDLWDHYASGGTIEELRKLSPQQIVQVCVADAPLDRPREELTNEERLLPCETGVIDLPAQLVLLAEVGYDGPITPVPDRQRMGNLGRDATIRQIGAAMDQLWKAAGLTPGGKLSAVRS